MLEYQNIKVSLKNVRFQFGQRKLLLLKKLELLLIWKLKKILERFMEKNCKKQMKKSLELKK